MLPQPYGLADALQFVEEFVPNGWATGSELTWVLRLPTGQVIGSIGISVSREEIGYWLGKDHRGHGYMTEAVRAVLDWWFARGARRVVWKCLQGNAPSVAVARTAGFKYQESAPQGQHQFDEGPSRYWYAVLEATHPRAPQPGWPAE